MAEGQSHLAKEVHMARREVGNAMRLLTEAQDTLVVVASLLNKAYDKSQNPEE